MRYLSLLLAASLVVIILFRVWPVQTSNSSTPLTQEVYLWQRDWNDAVTQSLRDHASAFSGLTILAGEISWQQNHQQFTPINYDASLLKTLHTPFGLALRIGLFPGTFKDHPELDSLPITVLTQARQGGLNIVELQIDFDCPESRLVDYAQWLSRIRSQISGCAIGITVLPGWLNNRSIAVLVESADSIVLQVHSLHRPRQGDPLALCNPAEAMAAVAKAARFNRPFRVALPTYSYLAAYNAQGNLLGIAAEGPEKTWPADAVIERLGAVPEAMADLVAQWRQSHPSLMTGIVWYRLPIATDHLNWQWITLERVMAGIKPHAAVSAAVRDAQDGSMELTVANRGDADAVMPRLVRVEIPSAAVVAADALEGYEVVRKESAIEYHIHSGVLPDGLPAGKSRAIGWLRLEAHMEVRAYVEP